MQLTASPVTPERNLANVCVVGCGHWGANLLRNFHTLGKLRAFCESEPSRFQWATGQYPEAKGYSRLEDALDDPDVEAVVVATPAEHHHRLSLAALRADRDVFVEKPLALDCEEGLEMVETARSRKRILMVGHLLRYHPAVLKIQEMLSQGVLGRIEYIYSNRLSMGKIRREENALWSFAPHDISIVLAFLGGMPLQVTATGGAYVQPNIADVTVSNLLFDHGVRAHIFVSWLHPYKEQRLVVIGSKQMVVFEDTRPDNKLEMFDKRIEWKNGAIQAGKPQGTAVPFEPAEPLSCECAHFVECVASRQEPRTGGEEGVDVLRVLQACQRSLQMNGEPVQVNSLSTRKLAIL